MGTQKMDSSIATLLAGGGEACRLMQTIDWRATSLGLPSTWPASLKTAVGVLLRSRHPMFLWWGPDLIQFYNDAYIPSFGIGKHPAAMGQRGEDCWQEIWPIIWPQIDDVMARGVASWNEDQLVPIFRNGRIEEVYWTYGYSPVLDDDGTIGGTLVVCTETTNRVLASRRLESLRVLSQAASAATDSSEIIAGAAAALSQSPHDVPFALVYVVQKDSPQTRLERIVGVSHEVATALHGRISQYLPALAASTHAEAIHPDVALTMAPWPERVDHMCVTPIAIGDVPPVGYIVFGLSPRLPFDSGYAQYLRQLAEQVAQGLARIETFRIRAMVEGERNQLLEQAPVATALLMGPNHVFRLANPLFCEIVGRRDIVGRAYLEVFPELRDTSLPGILDRVYQTGAPFITNEMPIPLDRSGSGTPDPCYFKFNLEPIRNEGGHVAGMMAIAVDITAEVVARKTLERAQAEREQLLTELEAAARAKDEFLAMLGHELRNPLSPILTALQLMKLRGAPGIDRERAIIERQVKHVVGLVDDLLDISRITRGQLELKHERLRIADVIAKAIEQASPLLERREHGLDVNIPSDLFVEGDAGRLAQVVSNLLTNAAKYTERGGAITVTGRQDGNVVVLEVADNGIGIAPEILPRVFEAFTQERQPTDRSLGGLGLGLAIVKNLVSAHGGHVDIESAGRNRGTRAIVRLPAVTNERDPSRHQPSEPAIDQQAGCRVLLVDDNEDAVSLLAESLRALGHVVEVVFEASAALALASDFVPDVALLDLGLPVIDGYDLSQRLREHDGWNGVRFGALTGYAQQHDRDRSQAAGFAVHLVKPVDLAEVDAVIRRLRLEANSGH